MKKDKAYLSHIMDAISDLEKFTEAYLKKNSLKTKRNNMLF